MAIQSLQFQPVQTGITHEVIFAGDNVRLAGQIDYPNLPLPSQGFPLLFMLPDASCTSRACLEDQHKIGIEAGFAVFRWDKRGTGRSGAGGVGNPEQDAINAYQTAVTQADIDCNRIVIWAQTDASCLLGENYHHLKAIQQPLGIVLTGNMLNEHDILKLDTRIYCITGERDWNIASRYAIHVVNIHEKQYKLGSKAYVAQHANRKLTDTRNNMFHAGSEATIHDWLTKLCPNSTSI